MFSTVFSRLAERPTAVSQLTRASEVQVGLEFRDVLYREFFELTCLPACPFSQVTEHFRDYKYGNGNSKYAQHLLDNKHSIGPIHETMNILHTIKKKAK